MSLNVVGGAVIAIVVLIVIILIMTGKIQIFAGTIQDCHKIGGQCLDDCPLFARSSQKCPENQYCCVNQCHAAGFTCEPGDTCPTNMEKKFLPCAEGEVCCNG